MADAFLILCARGSALRPAADLGAAGLGREVWVCPRGHHPLSALNGGDPHPGFEAGADQFVEILDTDIYRVHLHTRLLTQARVWETRDRDRSLLLRGAELEEAETWLADQTGRKPAATRRQRDIGSTTMIVVVELAVLAAVAFIQRQTVVHQSRITIANELTTDPPHWLRPNRMP